jgi:serine/threonine/tyrosine-interacting protein
LEFQTTTHLTPGSERYEMRRQCQEILPGLFLGPFVASKSLETLNSLQISHMCVLREKMAHRSLTRILPHSVCIRDQKEAFSVRPRFPEHFRYLVLDVQDNEEQNLIRLFPECVHYMLNNNLCGSRHSARRAKQFIDNAIAGGGRVLVHCNGRQLFSLSENQ